MATEAPAGAEEAPVAVTSPEPAVNIFGWSRLDAQVLLAGAGLAMAMATAGADVLLDLRCETRPPRLPNMPALELWHSLERLAGAPEAEKS